MHLPRRQAMYACVREARRSLLGVYEQENQRSDIPAAYPSGLQYGCGKLGWDEMQRISLPLRFTCKSRQNRKADKRTRTADLLHLRVISQALLGCADGCR